jgi:hypothetical protein
MCVHITRNKAFETKIKIKINILNSILRFVEFQRRICWIILQFYLRYPEISRMINEQMEIISDSVLSVSISRGSLQLICIFDVGTLRSVKYVKLQRIHLANIRNYVSTPFLNRIYFANRKTAWRICRLISSNLKYVNTRQ